MNKVTARLLLAAVSVFFLFGSTVQAREAGDWLFRAGAGHINPKSDNGDIAGVDGSTTLVFNGTYMFSDNLGLEVLASLPFTHDVTLKSTGEVVGETKHLPPTVSLQYYFPTANAFTPYVGLGVNYTLFFDEKTSGALAGTDLDLDPSFGIATQVGFDYDFSDQMFLNLDVRWINIETDAVLDGAPLETVEIDPLVVSLTVGWTF